MPNGHSASGAGMATWFRDVNEENRPAKYQQVIMQQIMMQFRFMAV